jgi:LIVCS family branched-chain amino acid:cation transporter
MLMSTSSRLWSLFSIGMAMFSMFFGAGNIVIPLSLGQLSGEHTGLALLGLIVTAVIVPFFGIFAMLLYGGDYKAFFGRLGKWPGFAIALLIMGLLGPFGGLPRCIALSFSTMNMFVEEISIIPFSILACLFIYITSIKKTNVCDFVGWILSPFFLISFLLIIIMGYMDARGEILPSSYSSNESFILGLTSGYNTMDLLGSFFFSGLVVGSLQKLSRSKSGSTDRSLLLRNALISSGIGAFLLAFIYVGMSAVAALHAGGTSDVSVDKLLAAISLHVLGKYAGVVTCFAVIFACITTAIALASVFAEFAKTSLFADKISYKTALIGTLIISFFVSTLEFQGILKCLSPIIQVLYPVLILLCIVNVIKHKSATI